MAGVNLQTQNRYWNQMAGKKEDVQEEDEEEAEKAQYI